jgi:hypothetical protein
MLLLERQTGLGQTVNHMSVRERRANRAAFAETDRVAEALALNQRFAVPLAGRLVRVLSVAVNAGTDEMVAMILLRPM